jgi:hypothetical protein
MRVGVPTRYHLLRVPSTSSARRASPPAHTRVSHARGGGALPTGALQRRGGAGGDGAVRDGRRGGRRGGGRAATGRASSGGRARGQGARGPQRRRRQEVRTDTTPHEFVVLRTALRCSPLSVRRSPHLIEDHGERWFEGAVSEVGGGGGTAGSWWRGSPTARSPACVACTSLCRKAPRACPRTSPPASPTCVCPRPLPPPQLTPLLDCHSPHSHAGECVDARQHGIGVSRSTQLSLLLTRTPAALCLMRNTAYSLMRIMPPACED